MKIHLKILILGVCISLIFNLVFADWEDEREGFLTQVKGFTFTFISNKARDTLKT